MALTKHGAVADQAAWGVAAAAVWSYTYICNLTRHYAGHSAEATPLLQASSLPIGVYVKHVSLIVIDFRVSAVCEDNVVPQP